MLPDGRLRFENFVVGSANRLAVAAARAVAEAPGSVYNPLVVYSGSGLGKTHLLAAVGNFARQLNPALRVEFTPLDELVEQLHAAISAGEADALRKRYQEADLFLLDDVQFLTGRRETQSELLRLLNALQSAGRQIVMTSDRPPSEIADLDERLVTRFAGGLTVDIGAPDYETRVAILRTRCLERGAQLQPGVAEEIARIDFVNVRELQGALNRVIAHEALGEGPVEAAHVHGLLGLAGVRRPTPAIPAARNEFASFLSDVATVVAKQVEGWRVRIGEAAAFWSGEGYRTGVLQRALSLPAEPDVDGLLSMFAAAVDRLKALEQQITAVDAQLGGNEVFRDPERVPEAEEMVARALSGETPPAGPESAFARGAFEVGPSNQLAVRAADAVVDAPGQRYNPLFIHGPSGVGKTHLAHAIGNEMVDASGGAMRVACLGAQAFVDELISALQDGNIERWRNRLRAADALVVDDVQFIAGKERTQEELFHVFNALVAEGKQLVFTSDRTPKDMPELEERLRSRFEGGLIVEIQAPDRALRERLYARYLENHAPEAALLAFLADRPAASVREIIGTATRLVAAAELSGVPVGLDLARAELEGAGSASAAAPTALGAGVDAFFLDDEKVVWDWPDVGGRAIEELR